MKNTTNLLAHIALFSVQLLYAANFTIAKEVMPNFVLPKGIIFMRISFGLIAFWLVHLLFIKAKEINLKDIPLLILCGIFGAAVNQICFFVGLNWTKPINASIIMLITPIIVFVGAVLFFKESYRKVNIVGIIIGCLGAGLLIGYGQDISFSSNGLIGDIYVLVNATSYSIYLLIARPLLLKYHPVVIMKWVFTFGFFFALPFTYHDFIVTDWQAIPSPIWAAIAYILIGATFTTYLFNSYALRNVSPKTVGAYIYLQPILAVIIAIAAGKDQLTILKLITGILIFTGVYLASKKKKSLSNE
jgi:drug/metabolite transporter (DMT)-like permease